MVRRHRREEGVATAARKIRAQREEARPIKRVLDRRSRDVVGWLYEWNTGERMVMWRDGKRDDVVYE